MPTLSPQPNPPRSPPGQQTTHAPGAREGSVATTHSLQDLAEACVSHLNAGFPTTPNTKPNIGSPVASSSKINGHESPLLVHPEEDTFASDLPSGFVYQGDGSVRRILPNEVIPHPLFPAFYQAFWTPTDSVAKQYLPASPCAGATTCHCVGGECEQIVHKDPNPRTSLYTPRITKGRGREKLGLCPICFEPSEKGGESMEVWQGLPTSKYRAHMIEKHGISTIDGGPYSPPLSIREVKSVPVRSRKKEVGTKYLAMCHQCNQEVELVDTCAIKRQRTSAMQPVMGDNNNNIGTKNMMQRPQPKSLSPAPNSPDAFLPKAYKTWFRHATDCHVVRLSDIHGTRSILAQHVVSRIPGEGPNTYLIDAPADGGENAASQQRFVRTCNRDTLKVKGVKWGRTLRRDQDQLEDGEDGVGEGGVRERGAKRRKILLPQSPVGSGTEHHQQLLMKQRMYQNPQQQGQHDHVEGENAEEHQRRLMMMHGEKQEDIGISESVVDPDLRIEFGEEGQGAEIERDQVVRALVVIPDHQQ